MESLITGFLQYKREASGRVESTLLLPILTKSSEKILLADGKDFRGVNTIAC